MKIEEIAKKAYRKRRLPSEEHTLLLRFSYIMGLLNKKEFLKLQEALESGKLSREDFLKEVFNPISNSLVEVLSGFYQGLLHDLPEGFTRKGKKEIKLEEEVKGTFVRFSKGVRLMDGMINAFPSTQRIFYREALERLSDIVGNPEWLKSIDISMLSRLKRNFTSYVRALKRGNITLSLAHSKSIKDTISYSNLIVEINSRLEETLQHIEELLGIKRRKKEMRDLHHVLLRGGMDVKTYIHQRKRLVDELGAELLHEEREYMEDRVKQLDSLEETVSIITPLISTRYNLSRRDAVLRYLNDNRETIPYEDYPHYVLFTFQPFTSADRLVDIRRIQTLKWDLRDLMVAGGITETTFKSYLRAMAVILEGNLRGTARAESLYDTLEVMRNQGLQNAWQNLRTRLEATRRATEAIRDSGVEPPEEYLKKIDEMEEILKGDPEFALLERVMEELKGVEIEIQNIMRGKEEHLIKERAENILASLKALQAEGLEVAPLLERVQETLMKESIVNPMQELIELYEIERETGAMEEELRERKLQSMRTEIVGMLQEARERGLEVAMEEEALSRIDANWNRWDRERLSKELQALNYALMNRVVSTRKEELKEQLQILRKEAEESSATLDLSEAMSLLSEAEKMFERNQLEFADAYLRRAQETLEMNRKVLLTDTSFTQLNRLKEEVAALKETGADVFEVEQLLTEAEDLLIKERYEEAKTALDQVNRSFTSLREEYLNYFIPQQINQIREASETLSKKGIPSRFLTTRLEELEEALKSGDLRGSLRLLNETRKSLERVYLTDNVTALPERIMRLRETKERLKGYGVAVEDVEALLEEAERLLSSEEFDKVNEITERVEGILQERKVDFQKKSYETMYNRSQELIEMLRREGIEVKIPELEINLAQDSYSKGDFSKAFNLMRGVVSYLEREAQESYFSRKKQIYFDEIEELKSTYMELPEDARKEFEESLKSVEESLLMDDLESAEGLLEKMREIVNRGREHVRMEALKKSVETMSVLINRLHEAGVDVGEAPEMLKAIQEEIESGNIDMAEELTEKLEAYLREEKRGALEENLKSEIEGLRRRAKDLRKAGLDVDYVTNALSKAEELIDEGRVDEASKVIGEAEELIKAAEMVVEESKFYETAEEVEQLIEELKKEGLEIPEEDLLKKARDLANAGEMGEAEEMLRRLKGTLTEKQRQVMEDRFTDEVGRIVKDMALLKEEGLEIEEVETRIKEATEKFQEGEYSKAFQILKDLKPIIDELKGARELGGVKKNLERILAAIEYYERRRRKLPTKLRELESAIKLSLESGDEEEMLNVLEEVNNIKMGKKLARAISRNLSLYSTELLKKLRPEKEVVEGIAEKMTAISKLMEREDYVEAVKEGLILLGLLLEMRKRKKLGKELKRIEALRKEIELLRNEGYSVETIENILTEAEVEFQEGDYDRAEELLRKGKNYLNELRVKHSLERARDAIDFSEALIRYLKDNFVGISGHLREPEKLLKNAREEFIKRNYEKAESYALRARELIEGNEELNPEQFLYVFYTLHLNERISKYISRMEAMREKVGGVDEVVEELKELKKELEGGMDPSVGEMRLTEIRARMRILEEKARKNEAFETLNKLYKKFSPYMGRTEKGFREAFKYYNLAKEAFSFQEYSKTILYSKRALFMLKRALLKEKKKR